MQVVLQVVAVQALHCEKHNNTLCHKLRDMFPFGRLEDPQENRSHGILVAAEILDVLFCFSKIFHFKGIIHQVCVIVLKIGSHQLA